MHGGAAAGAAREMTAQEREQARQRSALSRLGDCDQAQDVRSGLAAGFTKSPTEPSRARIPTRELVTKALYDAEQTAQEQSARAYRLREVLNALDEPATVGQSLDVMAELASLGVLRV